MRPALTTRKLSVIDESKESGNKGSLTERGRAMNQSINLEISDHTQQLDNRDVYFPIIKKPRPPEQSLNSRAKKQRTKAYPSFRTQKSIEFPRLDFPNEENSLEELAQVDSSQITQKENNSPLLPQLKKETKKRSRNIAGLTELGIQYENQTESGIMNPNNPNNPNNHRNHRNTRNHFHLKHHELGATSFSPKIDEDSYISEKSLMERSVPLGYYAKENLNEKYLESLNKLKERQKKESEIPVRTQKGEYFSYQKSSSTQNNTSKQMESESSIQNTTTNPVILEKKDTKHFQDKQRTFQKMASVFPLLKDIGLGQFSSLKFSGVPLLTSKKVKNTINILSEPQKQRILKDRGISSIIKTQKGNSIIILAPQPSPGCHW